MHHISYHDGQIIRVHNAYRTDHIETPQIITSLYFFSTAPENFEQTENDLQYLASTLLNIEIAHSLAEIIETTYRGKAFYIHAPDCAPHTDGFIQNEQSSINDYIHHLHLNPTTLAHTCGPLAFIAQHGTGDTLTVTIPQFNAVP